MLLKVFVTVVLLAFLQSTEVAGDGLGLSDKTMVVIVHKATGKVVASDGTLWDLGEGERWKQWVIFAKGAPPYYLLKTGLDRKIKRAPRAETRVYNATLVMGTSDKSCSASKVDKVGYLVDNQSQIWKLNSGVTPIFNKCDANNQLIVKQDGDWTRVFTTSPSNVKAGDENSLFEVLPTADYMKSMKG